MIDLLFGFTFCETRSVYLGRKNGVKKKGDDGNVIIIFVESSTSFDLIILLSL